MFSFSCSFLICVVFRCTTGETQFISRPNFQAGVVMYFSYMLLFMQYALGRFLPNGGRGKVGAGGEKHRPNGNNPPPRNIYRIRD